MAAGRFSFGNATYVEAPEFAPVGGGILDTAEVREVQAGDPALRGYRFESELPEVSLGTVTTFNQSSTSTLVEGDGHTYEVSADPFTVYGAFGLDLPLTDSAEGKARAQRRLELGEGMAVEKALWDAGGMLPTQASIVRPGGMKAKIAVGLLAEWWAQSNNGLAYFHGGRRVTNEVASQQLVDFDAEAASLSGGGAMINGAGYFGKTTIGAITPTADQAWFYISGKPLIYRSNVLVTEASIAQTQATANNRLIAFAQRTYVPSIDGPIGAVLIDLTL